MLVITTTHNTAAFWLFKMYPSYLGFLQIDRILLFSSTSYISEDILSHSITDNVKIVDSPHHCSYVYESIDLVCLALFAGAQIS